MFTKGEWEVIGNFVAVQKEDGNSYEICKVSNHLPEAKENACLISAAPDMYEALKCVLVDLNGIDELALLQGLPPYSHLRKWVEEALKKAEECGQ